MIVGDRRRFIALIAIMAAVTAVVTTGTVWLLYTNAMEYQRIQLADRARTTAGLLNGFAKIDQAYAYGAPKASMTFNVILDIAQRGVSFGKTGEFIIVRRTGDMIEVLVASRTETGRLPDPIPINSPSAELMRQALSGQSGVVKGLDGRGKEVLAAYGFASAAGMGILTKIDLAELHAPFVRAGFIAISLAVVLVVAGAYLFRRIGNPILARLQGLVEAEVRENRQTVRSILETALDGVCAFDSDGTIYFWNPSAEKVCRFTGDYVIGRNFIDVLLPERARAAARQELERFATTGEWVSAGRTVQMPMLRKSGQEFDAEISFSKFQADGSWRIVGYFRDATERNRNEQALKEARDAAQSATEAKSQFLATMSHEIRTPMNGIVGMIDLLRGTKLDEDQRDMLGTVRESTYALLHIINDILDFSKIEAGKMELESTSISVRDVVEGVAQTLAPNAAHKNVAIINFIDPEIPEWVMADPVRLRQILFNLAGNAVKFTDSTGKQGIVEIRADLVGETAEEVHIKYSVLDNGIGMTKEGQETLFRPFSQAEASTARRFGGTGLGLSICANLARLMGSEILLDSQFGAGSTFFATVKHPKSDRSPTHDEDFDLTGVDALQVIAIEQVREISHRYLKYHGANVHWVDDIKDAKDAIDRLLLAKSSTISVLLGLKWSDDEVNALRSQFAAGANDSAPRFVRMVHGKRLSVRQANNDMVVVDVSPMRRLSFLKAIATSIGRASPDIRHDVDVDETPRTIAPDVETAEANGQLILVAEDNATNRNVIRRQLNQLGYATEIVNDGREAIEAMTRRRYALLLTDCHMPNLDGYELTKLIREREGPRGSRLPIIAITANALQGEADRCIAAGMDDYLVKPFDLDVLKQKIKMWLAAASDAGKPASLSTSAAKPTIVSPQSPSVVDPSRLLRFLGSGTSDEDVKEVLREFVAPATQAVDGILVAYDQHVSEGMVIAAHTLRSSSRMIGADYLSDLCGALEVAGRSSDWDTITIEAPKLRVALDEVVAYINGMG